MFGDDEAAAKIIDALEPKTAKALGRTVRDFDDNVWKSRCRSVVTEGNLAKFSQNDELRDYLLSTGETVLVEASPYDRIRGIGLKQDDKRAVDPVEWRGSNLLGFALMDVRAELRVAGEVGS